MSSNKVEISKLRCEPYYADIPECREGYYGPPELILWRVFVDDECVSREALPFDESATTLELAANKCFPIFGDGGDYVIVRLAGDKIVWFGIYSYFAFSESKLLIDTVYVFDIVQYQQSIQQATAALSQPKPVKESQPNFLHKLLNTVFGILTVKPSVTHSPSTATTIKPIPTLRSQDIKDALLEVFPYDWDLPLYRIPELADDRRGERLYRAVWEAISLQEIWISAPPPTSIEVRIGLDKEVFVECLWKVGRVGDDIAILFVVEPHFPLWLKGFQSIKRFVDDALKALDE